ncbi:hypothetical protein M8C21_006594, partial [Ambrosia artemisiifolia]
EDGTVCFLATLKVEPPVTTTISVCRSVTKLATGAPSSFECSEAFNKNTWRNLKNFWRELKCCFHRRHCVMHEIYSLALGFIFRSGCESSSIEGLPSMLKTTESIKILGALWVEHRSKLGNLEWVG